MKNSRIRRAGIGITGFAAMATAAVIAAPGALADTTNNNLTVAGSNFYSNTAYTVTANISNITDAVNVWFYDNGNAIVPSGQNSPGITPANGTATLNWTPTTDGTHQITATVAEPGNNVWLGPVTVSVTDAPVGGGGGNGALSNLLSTLLSSLSASAGNGQ
ncbi:Ig-like domain-containing protein [Nocardia sp. NPDC088792]|uniref:Ig-like domain-containing protein n=1 Tax=Nocardia sp. NPDC088792 TaxID=3364332 RepID=UPI0037FEFB28